MKLHTKRFQRQSDQGPVLFAVTYRATITDEERQRSQTYPLDPKLVYEATSVMSEQLPDSVEYTEFYETIDKATDAEDDRRRACGSIVAFLRTTSQFGGEDEYEFEL